jgi:hypothetical protein
MQIRQVLTQFLRFYAATLWRSAYYATISPVVSPRKALRFYGEVLDSQDRSKPCPVLGSREVQDVFPAAQEIIIHGRFQDGTAGGTHSLLELAALAAAVKYVDPQCIFEIGTHVGRTSRILLLNSKPSCRLYTLDLPTEKCRHEPGRDLKGTSEMPQVTLLSGDSREFDFTPWAGKCDLVWVDGSHEYDYVKADSENALRIVSERGWILWHDYRHTHTWDGVTRYLRELKKTRPALFHLNGTTIAGLKAAPRE